MSALKPIPMKYRSHDLGFPKGWYAVADSTEVTGTALLPVSYLDQQLIVYRDAHGRARVADAYCPHLGAHLASHDGCLSGGRIVCPFHKWSFDATSGQCVNIPYTNVMVPGAVKLTIHPTREVDDIVMMWYHPRGEAPDYEPFSRSQLNTAGHWVLHSIKDLVSTCPFQDLFENLFDTAHIQQLHGGVGLPTIASIERVPHGLRVQFGPPAAPEQFAITHMESNFSGVTMTHLFIEGEGFAFTAAATATPIDKEHFRNIARLYVRDMGSKEMNDALGGAFAQRTFEEIDQDMNVLNFKKHLARPNLCAGDGPIYKWRKYQDEFYV
jgi:nitrite reductase/ring-hydroxylating ferredoxin subunit